jgi:hypothetical protein
VRAPVGKRSDAHKPIELVRTLVRVRTTENRRKSGFVGASYVEKFSFVRRPFMSPSFHQGAIVHHVLSQIKETIPGTFWPAAILSHSIKRDDASRATYVGRPKTMLDAAQSCEVAKTFLDLRGRRFLKTSRGRL